MRFRGLVFIALLSLPVPLAAQDTPPPRDPLPNFSIAPRGEVQLPRIGVPLPAIVSQPRSPSRPGGQGDARGRQPRPRHRGTGRLPWVVYVVPQVVEVAPAAEPARREPPPTGRLILDVQPETAQIYAGGYYLGTAGDLAAAGGGAVLEAGPYRIDVSASGYDAVTFLASIRPNQPTTYRQQLKRVAPTPAPASRPETPTTFYLIPGCYMGNVPPNDARLPPTCDISRAVKF